MTQRQTNLIKENLDPQYQQHFGPVLLPILEKINDLEEDAGGGETAEKIKRLEKTVERLEETVHNLTKQALQSAANQ